jgi:phage portal protein BeeE
MGWWCGLADGSRKWVGSCSQPTASRDIALAFGVPPMLLGIPGDNTYANYREANRAFYRLTVLPLVGRTAKDLSNWRRIAMRCGRA